MSRVTGMGNCLFLHSRGWRIEQQVKKKSQIPGVLGEIVTATIEPRMIKNFKSKLMYAMSYVMHMSTFATHSWKNASPSKDLNSRLKLLSQVITIFVNEFSPCWFSASCTTRNTKYLSMSRAGILHGVSIEASCMLNGISRAFYDIRWPFARGNLSAPGRKFSHYSLSLFIDSHNLRNNCGSIKEGKKDFEYFVCT